MSHVLDGIRLVMAIPEVDPEKARQRIQACSVGLDGKYSEEAFLACPSCQDLARRIEFAEMREEHESFPPEREWARGIDCD